MSEAQAEDMSFLNAHKGFRTSTSELTLSAPPQDHACVGGEWLFLFEPLVLFFLFHCQ